MNRFETSPLPTGQGSLVFQEEFDYRLLFVELHRRLTGKPAPDFAVDFYPYAGFKHTIRSRHGKVLIRLSDLLEGAPHEVFEATMALLICRLYSAPAPSRFAEIYTRFAASPEVRKASLNARSRRGSKRLSSARGTYHNLLKLFSKVNSEYFEGRLKVRHISWSPGRSRRVLGQYDRAHDAIVLNRRLDHPLVPGFVVEYVLYHEMLHAALGDECQGRRRKIHHERFLRAERKFADYSRARRFIHQELC